MLARSSILAAALAAVLSGCAGNTSVPPAPATAPLNPQSTQSVKAQDAKSAPNHAHVYVSVGGPPGSINVFDVGARGNVVPKRVIAGTSTRLNGNNGIVVTKAGEIFVANSGDNTILGFSPSQVGDVAPNIVISGAQTGLSVPVGIAIDANDNLFVANCGSACRGGEPDPSVVEFAAGTSGNATPIKVITGSDTQLVTPNAIALDSAGAIYVTNRAGANTVTIFASDANGNVAPQRVIAGGETLLNEPNGLAVDDTGIYVGSEQGQYIERFAPAANGDVGPVALIFGNHTHIGAVDGLATGPKGNLYAANEAPSSVLRFHVGATGNAKPSHIIAGPATQLNNPVFVYVR